MTTNHPFPQETPAGRPPRKPPGTSPVPSRNVGLCAHSHDFARASLVRYFIACLTTSVGSRRCSMTRGCRHPASAPSRSPTQPAGTPSSAPRREMAGAGAPDGRYRLASEGPGHTGGASRAWPPNHCLCYVARAPFRSVAIGQWTDSYQSIRRLTGPSKTIAAA